jgi:hypothetical protein
MLYAFHLNSCGVELPDNFERVPLLAPNIRIKSTLH